MREGLSKMIGGSEGFIVSGLFSSMEEAIPNIGMYSPWVALVDLGLPGMSQHGTGFASFASSIPPLIFSFSPYMTMMTAYLMPSAPAPAAISSRKRLPICC